MITLIQPQDLIDLFAIALIVSFTVTMSADFITGLIRLWNESAPTPPQLQIDDEPQLMPKEPIKTADISWVQPVEETIDEEMPNIIQLALQRQPKAQQPDLNQLNARQLLKTAKEARMPKYKAIYERQGKAGLSAALQQYLTA